MQSKNVQTEYVYIHLNVFHEIKAHLRSFCINTVTNGTSVYAICAAICSLIGKIFDCIAGENLFLSIQ